MKSRSQTWRSAGLRKARSGEANWAVSYVDVLTLLLCFFIVFYSAGEKTEKKSEVLNLIVGQFGSAESRNSDVTGNVEDQNSTSTNRKPAAERSEVSAAPSVAAVNADWIESLNVALDQKENVQVKTEAETVYVSFRTVEFFTPGSIELTSTGRGIVERFSKVMLAHKDKIRVAVQGHTDGRQVSPGKHQYRDNWELSVLRATRVLSFMIRKGFDSSALSAEGYADTRAIASTEDLHPRRISFRIEPRLVKTDDKAGGNNENK